MDAENESRFPQLFPAAPSVITGSAFKGGFALPPSPPISYPDP